MKEERKEPIQIPHIQTINDHISYLTPTEHPLSANVVIIEQVSQVHQAEKREQVKGKIHER